MAAPARAWAADLLHLWFRRLRPRDWFGGSPAVDALLRRRFERTLAALWPCQADDFLDNPATALASVVLFDQIPRNLFGSGAQAFAYDPLARAITHAAIARGWDRGLNAAQRQFLYMPLMHSEAIADQRLSLRLFADLPRHGWAYARSHHAMIARFGRFPHRNAALGRTSTAAERRAIEAGFSW